MRITLILITLVIGSNTFAQTRNYYGPDGNYEGQSTQVGPNERFFYGSDGSYGGMSMKSGNFTNYYGADGAYLGNSSEMNRNTNNNE